MYRLWIRLIALGVVLSICTVINADEKKMTVGKVTVTYPADLEPQAKELAEAANRVAGPFLEDYDTLHQKRGALLRELTQLLGCSEDKAVKKLIAKVLPKDFFQLSPQFVTHYKLYKASTIRQATAIQDGGLRVLYDKENDTFSAEYKIHVAINESFDVKSLFTPEIVEDDGSFYHMEEANLEEGLIQQLRKHLFVRPEIDGLVLVHETAEAVLTREYLLYHPFTRWFNDGVANWAAYQVIAEVIPEMRQEVRQNLFPQTEDAALRSQVNLLTWPQPNYVKQDASIDEEKISVAQYKYAAEAIDRMLDGQPKDTLAKIFQDAKKSPFASTDLLCAIISKHTGKDAKQILLDYVPEQVRSGIKDRTANKLYDAAFSPPAKNDFHAGIEKIATALEIEPSNINMRLDMAILMQKAQYPKAEYERQILITSALYRIMPDHSFQLHLIPGTNDDVSYTFGRIEQHIGRVQIARDFLNDIGSDSPKYAEAQAALKEIAEAEKKQKEKPR